MNRCNPISSFIAVLNDGSLRPRSKCERELTLLYPKMCASSRCVSPFSMRN